MFLSENSVERSKHCTGRRNPDVQFWTILIQRMTARKSYECLPNSFYPLVSTCLSNVTHSCVVAIRIILENIFAICLSLVNSVSRAKDAFSMLP